MTQITTRYNGIISNEKFDVQKVEFARQVILQLQNELSECIKNGSGPFLASIYDEHGNLVSKCSNSVISDSCSNNHAEINAIRKAEEIFGSYDLSQYNLSIYVTSEPCMMCLGAILWSGIKAVYYGVESCDVEKITGYDEGFKPNWTDEFAKRGITVYGNIESDFGKEVLQEYIKDGNIVYKPLRK